MASKRLSGNQDGINTGEQGRRKLREWVPDQKMAAMSNVPALGCHGKVEILTELVKEVGAKNPYFKHRVDIVRCRPEGEHPDQRFVEECQRVSEEDMRSAESDDF